MAKAKKDENAVTLESLVETGKIVSVRSSANNIAVVVKEGTHGINHDAVEIEALLEQEYDRELLIKNIAHTNVEGDYSGKPCFTVLYETVTVEEVPARGSKKKNEATA